MIDLSKHIEILLLSNDCVIVPGFGGFMAHHIDARKDKEDGSFLPPIRSIGFNPKLTINDSLLAQSYVEAYDISYPDATMRIEDEVRELRQRIANEGSYEFSDLGVIKLNSDGNYEFEPCEAGILSPVLYGLGSFQMKTLQEIKAAAMKANAVDIQTSATDNQPDQPKASDEEQEIEHKHAARIIALWRNVAVACIAIIFFLIIPSPIVNNSQIAGNSIDTKLLDKVMPKDITTGREKVDEAVKSFETKKAVAQKSVVAPTEKEENAETPVKEGYSVVVASHVTIKNAKAYVNDLRKRGYDDAFVHRNGHVKVLLGHYKNREEASQILNKLNNDKEFAGAWIIEL